MPKLIDDLSLRTGMITPLADVRGVPQMDRGTGQIQLLVHAVSEGRVQDAARKGHGISTKREADTKRREAMEVHSWALLEIGAV